MRDCIVDEWEEQRHSIVEYPADSLPTSSGSFLSDEMSNPDSDVFFYYFIDVFALGDSTPHFKHFDFTLMFWNSIKKWI